jgi:AraC-like DNA-binding protein/quercetin dioxygenase-like cupin family protein
MSPDGQSRVGGDGGAATVVATFPMPSGRAFAWHAHDRHQLAWASSGVLVVLTEASTWVLPPSRALWIPAGLTHETRAYGRSVMQTVYLRVNGCPIEWPEATPVAVSSLLAELIAYLGDVELTAEKRSRAEALLIDLLRPMRVSTIELQVPLDPRARDVADALTAQPADRRTLAEWGRHVGASERTLARVFVAGTGLSFGRWRTRLRLQAALPTLAEGGSIMSASLEAGFSSPSAFAAAFRREIGTTPARYFRAGSDHSASARDSGSRSSGPC